jgi:hypothetical protein
MSAGFGIGQAIAQVMSRDFLTQQIRNLPASLLIRHQSNSD